VVTINLAGKEQPAEPEPKNVAKEEAEPEGDNAQEGNASA